MVDQDPILSLGGVSGNRQVVLLIEYGMQQEGEPGPKKLINPKSGVLDRKALNSDKMQPTPFLGRRWYQL